MRITKFYIDKAVYRVGDDSGREVQMEIDYWNNSFKISDRSKNLEDYAKKLLKKKHRVNFVYKMIK